MVYERQVIRDRVGLQARSTNRRVEPNRPKTARVGLAAKTAA